jgi:alkylation response protein AidB-like acyl-CoA dehydrogenase
LSDEQEFLTEAATGMLGRERTVAGARESLEMGAGPALWELAIEAGWPGLLSDEGADGAGLGCHEAMLVLEACGAVLADARLLGHLPACALLELAGASLELRCALARGQRRASLVDGQLGIRNAPLRARVEGDLLHLSGTVRGALDAAGADTLVLVAVDPAGELVAGAVDHDAAGVVVEPMPSYDGTRSLGVVTLDGAWAIRLDLSPARIDAGCSLQRALLAAESVGAADACLRMARDYALDRRAFGRPIGSYQAIKHKLVEMLRQIESARSLLRYAGEAWTRDPACLGSDENVAGQFALAANAARVLSVEALDYCAPENIFIHGGIGATWEHDAQLYYRRAEVARRLAGGAEAAAEAVADELFAGSGLGQRRS